MYTVIIGGDRRGTLIMPANKASWLSCVGLRSFANLITSSFPSIAAHYCTISFGGGIYSQSLLISLRLFDWIRCCCVVALARWINVLIFLFFLFVSDFRDIGCEDAGCGRGHLRYVMAALSWHVGVQQFCHHALETQFYGPLVPHVCQNVRLHQQVFAPNLFSFKI